MKITLGFIDTSLRHNKNFVSHFKSEVLAILHSSLNMMSTVFEKKDSVKNVYGEIC